MNLKFCAAAFACITFAGQAAASATVQTSNPPEMVKTAAGNTYVYRHLQTAKRIAIAISWPAPFEILPDGKEGLTFLVPALMLESGADGKSAAELRESFKDLDSVFALRPRPERINALFVAPADNAIAAAAAVNGIFARPSFTTVWLQRLKLKLRRSNEQFLARAAAKAILVGRKYSVGDHRYFNAAPFSRDSAITNVTLADAKAWHRNVFVQSRARIVATGGAPKSVVSAIVDRLFDGIPEHPLVNPPTSELPAYRLDGKTIVLVDHSVKTSAIIMAAGLPWSKSITDASTRLSVHLLGQGAQSRMFEALRSELGATYRVRTTARSTRKRVRLLLIGSEIETAKLARAIPVLHAAYAKFVNAGVTAAELDAGSKRVSFGLSQQMSVPIASSRLILAAQVGGRSLDYFQKVEAHFHSITADKLNAHIANAFPPLEKTLTIIVTPDARGIAADCVVKRVSEIAACER